MKPKILVTKHLYPEAITYLRERAEVEYHDADEGYPPEQLLERLRDKQGVVSQLTDKFSAEVMDKLPQLRAISNVAVGFDNIDVPAATARKIAVTNTPEVLTDTTADFAFALLMAAARRVVEGDHFLRAGKYRQWRIDLLCGYDVHHRTLGVVGMGRIGQAVARRGLGFSMKLLYHDAVRAPSAVETELRLEFVPLDRLLAESDFISLHVPLLPQTHHLIGAPQLARM
ncbi:MAG TPA: NAD(P)-dependent oxidoreductase, partial [Bryobacterales bacterium]|nr:NAD(P)-dependent oxidoreductase [Bryobacterales bacterium]